MSLLFVFCGSCQVNTILILPLICRNDVHLNNTSQIVLIKLIHAFVQFKIVSCLLYNLMNTSGYRPISLPNISLPIGIPCGLCSRLFMNCSVHSVYHNVEFFAYVAIIFPNVSIPCEQIFCFYLFCEKWMFGQYLPIFYLIVFQYF